VVVATVLSAEQLAEQEIEHSIRVVERSRGS